MTIYTCRINNCGLTFSDPHEITLHKKDHSVEVIKCDYKDCIFYFTSNFTYTAHYRKKHLGLKPYLCNECNKDISQLGDYIKHMRVHTGEKPFECDICHESFRMSAHLTVHYRTHTGERPFKCEFEGCNSSFAQTGQLTTHIRIHTGERPFICDYCGKDFPHATSLTVHTRIHTGERPFTCEFKDCSESFIHASHLVEHFRIHTGERPYKCEFEGCPDTFRTSSLRNDHFKTHNNTYKQRQKRKEQGIADFLIKNNIIFNREHRVDFGKCINSNDGHFCLLDFTLLSADGKYLIVLECDESQHKQYSLSCEFRRMIDAHTSILTDSNNPLNGIHWIRFNPDAFKVNNKPHFYSLNDRYNKLLNIINNLQSNPPQLDFTITYLFYDTLNNNIKITKDEDFPKGLNNNIFHFP